MQNKEEIRFPRSFPGKKLGSKIFERNMVIGIPTKTADLGLKTSFFGGNVDVMFLLQDYGIYACVNRWNNDLVGFYVHDPAILTPLGKAAVEQQFAGFVVNYNPPAVQEMTAEEKKRWEELKEEAEAKGLQAALIDHTSAQGLLNALATIESGINKNAKVTVEEVAKSPVSKNPSVKTTIRGSQGPAFEV